MRFRRNPRTYDAISNGSALAQALLRGYVANGPDGLEKTLADHPDAATRGQAAAILVNCLEGAFQERYGDASGAAMLYMASHLRDNTAVVLAGLAAGGEG